MLSRRSPAPLTVFLVLLAGNIALAANPADAGSFTLRRTISKTSLCGHFSIGGNLVPLLVDTGAGVSGLNRTAVKNLGISPDPRLRLQVESLHGGNLGTEGAQLSVQIGSFTLSQRTPFVFLPSWTGTAAKPRGLLGVQPLDQAGAVLDLQNRRLLAPGSDALRQLRPQLADSVRLPLLRASGNPFVYVQCAQDRHQLVWMIDTGSTFTLLSQTKASRLGLKTGNTRHQLVDGTGTTEPVLQAQLKDSTWGSRLTLDLPVFVASLENLQTYRIQSGRSVDGILGMDFLTKHQAVLDFDRDALFLSSK